MEGNRKGRKRLNLGDSSQKLRRKLRKVEACDHDNGDNSIGDIMNTEVDNFRVTSASLSSITAIKSNKVSTSYICNSGGSRKPQLKFTKHVHNHVVPSNINDRVEISSARKHLDGNVNSNIVKEQKVTNDSKGRIGNDCFAITDLSENTDTESIAIGEEQLTNVNKELLTGKQGCTTVTGRYVKGDANEGPDDTRHDSVTDRKGPVSVNIKPSTISRGDSGPVSVNIKPSTIIRGDSGPVSVNIKPSTISRGDSGYDSYEEDLDEDDVIDARRVSVDLSPSPPVAVEGYTSWSGFAETSAIRNKQTAIMPATRGYELLSSLKKIINGKPRKKLDTIYIDHPKKTEGAKGDTFGADLLTYYEPSDPYHQHLLKKVIKEGPADTMKLEKYDELVLVRNQFVPNLTHGQVLQLFKTTPVDGRTRFELVIRRLRKPQKPDGTMGWIWMETSAVLDPDKQDTPEQIEVNFLAQNEKVQIFECRFKVPGSQFFINMDGTEVDASLLHGGNADMSKNLFKHVRYCNGDDGKATFYTALQSHDKRNYLAAQMGTNSIVAIPEIRWFSYDRVGSNIAFKVGSGSEVLYIACDVPVDTGDLKPRVARLVARRESYRFEEHGIPGSHYDEPDGIIYRRITRSMSATTGMQHLALGDRLAEACSSQTSSVHSDAGYCTSTEQRPEENGDAAEGVEVELDDDID